MAERCVLRFQQRGYGGDLHHLADIPNLQRRVDADRALTSTTTGSRVQRLKPLISTSTR